MPSEKRQRQDEGRLTRRVEMAAAAKKSQRNRQYKVLGGILVALVVGAFLWSVLAGDDGDDDVATGDSSSTSSSVVDDSSTSSTASTAPAVPGDPAIGEALCPPPEGTEERTTEFASGPLSCIDVTKTYTALVETSKGDFTIQLDAAAAPKTVNNFVFLARNRFYEGIKFHRIIPGFVVQGGDPQGTGAGGPGYEFADELPTAGPPYYEIGSLAMANSGPNTNGSQFFIVTGEQGAGLSADYSKFGKVTEGMDVVMAIEATGTSGGTPSEETTITKVTITES
jgi:cyclophilin family peptidyl-prolyl cis-trans isomerase